MYRNNETIVEILADGLHHTGEDIGAYLGVTRAAVWKQVEQARAKGLTIESSGKLGYRLIPPEDPLFPPLLDIPGCEIEYWHELVGSTNTRAAELARQGAEEGTLVLAEVQTGGRGRRERGWASPLGGAWFSLVLRPARPPSEAQRIPLVAAVAAAEACHDATGLFPGVKWPNDLMLNGRKLCGILLEMSVEAERVQRLVMGVGINVSQRRSDFPEALAETATSLAIEGGKPVKRGDVVRAFASRFWDWYRRLEAGGNAFYREVFLPAYASRSVTLGREVTVAADAGTYAAKAEAIGAAGELIVRMDGGALRPVWAADVSVR
ncbi:MAG: biotin--[acetyl-CoA-carboxylase] ligase [Oscillospiraceae bacterium]|jgi:BirA family biotin operon repressor/biotin-[acetyl-CoA-carboxylase] ligase|nr:biotin--[acetyl-CoA-carboxylase] ligase [Oscillospiraceae bacterium]